MRTVSTALCFMNVTARIVILGVTTARTAASKACGNAVRMEAGTALAWKSSRPLTVGMGYGVIVALSQTRLS